MNLLEQYQKQWKWREWSSLYDLLPSLESSKIYDLGCAHGDHSAEFIKRGANVIGIDGDRTLLDYAQRRDLKESKFLFADLSQIDQLGLEQRDGVWMSFVAAYFPNLTEQLERIKGLIRPGGWLAITEMDHLFGHQPLEQRWKELLGQFYLDAIKNGRYDFCSGSKLKFALEKSGFTLRRAAFLEDRELAFQGPCSEDVLKAWSDRLDRMGGLKSFLGGDFLSFKDDFLNCLIDSYHQSECRVYFYLAEI